MSPIRTVTVRLSSAEVSWTWAGAAPWGRVVVVLGRVVGVVGRLGGATAGEPDEPDEPGGVTGATVGEDVDAPRVEVVVADGPEPAVVAVVAGPQPATRASPAARSSSRERITLV